MATVKSNGTINLGFNQDFPFGIGQVQNLSAPFVLRTIFGVSGALADQCSKLHLKQYSLVASTPQNIDLQSLVDVSGATVSLAAVRVIAFRNNASTDGWVLLVGAAGANEWDAIVSASGTLTVYPASGVNDGFAVFQAPNTTGAVVDSTHRLLKLDPGPHSFTVDVLIAGF
jgi:hypothetical protein